jgi:hypothetical protein
VSKFLTALVLLGLCLLPATLHADTNVFEAWDGLLRKHVQVGHKQQIETALVNYLRLGKEPKYKQLILDLPSVSTANLKTRNQKLAFWINVYNIAAVKMVVEHYPVKSIKDLGHLFQSVWDKPAVWIGGRMFSLGHIEHKILRPLAEPRIHFAIVCASLSCPDLRAEAYFPDRLDAQLKEQVTVFLRNSTKGFRRVNANKIEVSAIFNWFQKDFDSVGGVTGFLEAGLGSPLGKTEIGYLPYNWSLNGLQSLR